MASKFFSREKVVKLRRNVLSRHSGSSGAASKLPKAGADAASPRGEANMSPTAEEIGAVVSRARELYERERAHLEANELYRYICINSESGEYVLGDTIDEVAEAYGKKFGSTPSWLTQVGNPDHIWTSARLHQLA